MKINDSYKNSDIEREHTSIYEEYFQREHKKEKFINLLADVFNDDSKISDIDEKNKK